MSCKHCTVSARDEILHVNAPYDSLNTNARLAADEVLDIPDIGVQFEIESFVRPFIGAFHDLLKLLSPPSQSSAGIDAAVGGKLVITPYTFSICCHKDQVIVFDSHSQRPGHSF